MPEQIWDTWGIRKLMEEYPLYPHRDPCLMCVAQQIGTFDSKEAAQLVADHHNSVYHDA